MIKLKKWIYNYRINQSPKRVKKEVKKQNQKINSSLFLNNHYHIISNYIKYVLVISNSID